MVLLTQILYQVKKLPRKYLRTRFIDSLRLLVRGGTGGAGLPRYGGIGGAGGNVYVVTKDKLNLQDVIKKLKTKRIKADAGGDSSAKGIIGAPGEDKIISVPCGITIYNQNGVILGELNKEKMKLLVAKGGNGGCEETGYCGLKGESQTIKLDMKLIADVGLVGFPNAGKSTFLAAVSRTKPKIADYPYLPGLIEGAHMNVGMGHKFLKHIERTKLLLFIIDIQGFQLSPKYTRRSCLETLVLLNKEIELYKPDLLKMPTIVIINKMDTDNADNILKEIKPALHDLSDYVATCPEEIRPEQIIQIDNILPVSLISKDKKQIEKIKERIRSTLDKYQERQHIIQYGDSLGLQLIDRIKQQTKQHTPTVI
ncbi:GTP-binding protein 10 homolog isoform X2 [Camponotus floridanus]|uniref:GTP-binding protein 10 homolog isoform X2 n=1 Tax=Camponotus floridanus TaxID=104421 RepID=UPI00059EC09A|nr:GTP-binding protein 10 homolog isoform X2 [Camponotus floridanus]